MRVLLLFIVAIFTLCSCSQGNRDFASSGNNLHLSSQPLSFVAASTYYYNTPTDGSNIELKLPIYVANNSSVNISGISYIESSAVSYVGVTSVDSSNCASVASGKTCKFDLNLSLESGIYNGSILIHAQYTLNSKQYELSTIVSFNSTTGSSQIAPVYDKSTLTTSESPNTYLELFYLVQGDSESSYTLNYINDGVYTILDSNVTNSSTVHGGDIVYMLLQTNNAKSSQSSKSVNSQNIVQSSTIFSGQIVTLTDPMGKSFPITANVATPQSTAGVDYAVPYIMPGSPSVITTQTQKVIAVNFLNVGNAKATITDLVYRHDLLSILDNNCGEFLESLQSCSVLFNTTSPSGTDNIVLNYTGTSLSKLSTAVSVNWYYDTSSPLIITTIQNLIGISQNVVSFVNVIITNLGAELHNVVYNASYANPHGAVSLNGINKCLSLLSNSSCQFEALLFSTAENSAPLIINGSGTYNDNQSYGFNASANVIASSVNDGIGVVSAESPAYDMNIIDNNYDSTTKTIIYRNVGTVPTKISSASLTYSGTSTQESWIYIQSNNCNGTTLQPNANCSVVVKLGPVIFPDSNMVVISTINLDAKYTYDKNGTLVNGVATALIKYQIGVTNYSVYVESVSAINSESGIGLLSGPYIFAGVNDNSVNPQQVVVSYKNNGSDPILITNIQQYVNTAYWQIANDGCSGNILNPQSGGQYLNSCQITYTNVYYLLSSMLPSTNRDFSFKLPVLIIQDIISGERLSFTPTYFGQTVINVFESMALLTHNVSLDNLGNVVLTQIFESYSGYPMVTFNTTGGYFIDQFISNNFPDYVNCNYDLSMGNLKQICTFNPSDTGSIPNNPFVITNTYSLLSPVKTGSCLSFYFNVYANNAVIGSDGVVDNSLCF